MKQMSLATTGFELVTKRTRKREFLDVTLLHPGGVRTGIATSARLPASVTAQEIKLHQKNWQKALRLSPEAAAQRILLGIERREPRVLVGDDAVVASWVQRLFPVTYWRWVALGMSRSFRDTH